MNLPPLPDESVLVVNYTSQQMRGYGFTCWKAATEHWSSRLQEIGAENAELRAQLEAARETCLILHDRLRECREKQDSAMYRAKAMEKTE